jgi:hypothetical protein
MSYWEFTCVRSNPRGVIGIIVNGVVFKGSTGVGQNYGNATDTVHISLLIWCWTTVCFQYSRSPSWNGLVQVLNGLIQVLNSL